jgi:imidazolonepropionase
MLEADFLLTNAGRLATVAAHPAPPLEGPLGVLRDGALAARNGRIVWVGAQAEVAQAVTLIPRARRLDAAGALVLPGFVDSHTHLVFAGHRAGEFHERLRGATYAELLAQGRGILATVGATRAASAADLEASARQRMARCLAHGTTTLEAKSGYGLSLADEIKCLHVVAALRDGPPRLVSTCMAAHTVPPEYRADRAAYVRLVCDQILPAARPLADFCDVFCETGAFDVAESRTILERARDLGYKLKLHANQLGHSGGAALAAELNAISADHLDFTTDADLAALRDASVVATLLPGCSYTLRHAYPDGRQWLDAGLKLSLATDLNPGSSYTENMQFVIGLAISFCGITVAEALRAATLGGAQALQFDTEIGSLEVGKRCDLTVWDTTDEEEIGYHVGVNLVKRVVVDGAIAI